MEGMMVGDVDLSAKRSDDPWSRWKAASFANRLLKAAGVGLWGCICCIKDRHVGLYPIAVDLQVTRVDCIFEMRRIRCCERDLFHGGEIEAYANRGLRVRCFASDKGC